ncbi:hypothetical protein OL229_22010 [Neisseriaceae bacterium JH1-16]|nr:hypothetical protein [Neisseriaceae bacterium JH1-16]
MSRLDHAAAGRTLAAHSFGHHLAHVLHRDWLRLCYWLAQMGQESESCPRCAAYHHCPPRSARRQPPLTH